MTGRKIGVALGSGGARGWSHIGVLQALAERRVRPEIVCGCSMGALVGAAYAAGRLSELDDWARRLTRRGMLGLLDFSLARGGLIDGTRIVAFMKTVLPDTRIENLDLPFIAVASDLVSSQEIWLRDGPLIEAVRASIAIPGVLSPARHGESWLADGGLTNPVPVSPCRALGAEVVIAVNPNSKLIRKDAKGDAKAAGARTALAAELAAAPPPPASKGLRNLAVTGLGRGIARAAISLSRRRNFAPSYLEVINTSLDVMADRIRSSRLAGDPPHCLIQPQLSHRSVLEFHRAAEAIEEGRLSTTRERSTLDALFGPA